MTTTSFEFRLSMMRREPFRRVCPTCRGDVSPLGRFIGDGASGALWLCDRGHGHTVPIKLENREDDDVIARSVALPFDLS